MSRLRKMAMIAPERVNEIKDMFGPGKVLDVDGLIDSSMIDLTITMSNNDIIKTSFSGGRSSITIVRDGHERGKDFTSTYDIDNILKVTVEYYNEYLLAIDDPTRID